MGSYPTDYSCSIRVLSMSGELIIETKCQYEIVDKDGLRHLCGKKSVAPSYPYCYAHSQKIGNPSERRFKRYEDHMPEYAREPYEHQLQDLKPQDLVPE